MSINDALTLSRTHKRVSFRFGGRDLFFHLSMGLFSSYDIDSGTRLLLKQLNTTVAMQQVHTVLDAGCGTGVLAVTLKKLFPHIRVDALDRDALALAVTAMNSRENDTDVSVLPGLDTLSPALHARDDGTVSCSPPIELTPKQSYDLIVTNIPAKAGEPVLSRFFSNSRAMLADDGFFAVVIVTPLRQMAERHLAGAGLEIVRQEHTGNHSLFITQAANRKAGDLSRCNISFPGPYLRNATTDMKIGNELFAMDTVFDLPGFDTVPYEQAALARGYRAEGSEDRENRTMLVWNPGQGHAALYLLKQLEDGSIPSVHIAGRDLLALAVTAHNIQKRFPEAPVTILHAPGIDYLATDRQYSLLAVFPDAIPGYSFSAMLQPAAANLLDSEGELLLAGKSSELSRANPKALGLTMVKTRKQRGYRSMLLKKQ